MLVFTHIDSDNEARPFEAVVDALVIAGWAGRDAEAVERHIRELEALGVPRPSQVPLFYRAAVDRLVTDERIEVLGEQTSGEVEVVLIGTDGGVLLGVGSDHTDRRIESVSVAAAKQMCPKPISRTLWSFADVAAHWDRLILRAWAVEGGQRSLYQEDPVSELMHPADLVACLLGADGPMPVGTALFCGTLPVRGAVRPAERFEIELEDPVRHRALRHGYDVVTLPEAA